MPISQCLLCDNLSFRPHDASGQASVQCTILFFVILDPIRPQYFWSALRIATSGKAISRALISKNEQRGEGWGGGGGAHNKEEGEMTLKIEHGENRAKRTG